MQPSNQYQQYKEMKKSYQLTSLLEKRPQTSFDNSLLTFQDADLLQKKVKLESSHSADSIISTGLTPSPETEICYFKQASAPEFSVKTESDYLDIDPFLDVPPQRPIENFAMAQPIQVYPRTASIFPPPTVFDTKLKEDDCILLGRVKPAKTKPQDSVNMLDNSSVQVQPKRGRKKKDSVKELEQRKYWQALEAQALTAYLWNKNRFQAAPGKMSMPVNSFNYNFPAINNNGNYLHQYPPSLLQSQHIYHPAQLIEDDVKVKYKSEPTVSTTYPERASQTFEEYDMIKQESILKKEEQNDLNSDSLSKGRSEFGH